ncbi:MAG TPA: S8 family serine peptidase, partial [Gemmatimonadales bacterium]|nr:S8 family serine peptidase [Gemmatimonadales bacterium]
GGPLAGSRAVINMSLGGSVLDAVEQESLDYATSNGVVVVAAVGNSGPNGNLSYPGGYAPVIAVASAGWIGEWNNRGVAPFNPACTIIDPAFDARLPGRFWRQCDVPEPYTSANFYVSSFSSRDPDGLDTGADYDLDVAAPGSWVVGPWGFNNGQINYAIAGGTSQATPHVAGIVALMLQKNPALTPAQIESCLETAAQPLTDTNQQVSPAPAGLVPAPLITPANWGTDRSGHGFITADAALNSSCFS